MLNVAIFTKIRAHSEHNSRPSFSTLMKNIGKRKKGTVENTFDQPVQNFSSGDSTGGFKFTGIRSNWSQF